MSLAETFRILRRRWAIVACGIVLVCVSVAGAVAVTPPSYEASGTVTLVPTEGNRDFVLPSGQTNALLGLDRDMAVVAGLVRAAVAGDGAAVPGSLLDDHTNYTLATSGDSGSALTISVTSRSATTATRTVAALQRAVADALVTEQAGVGVPDGNRITARSVSAPSVTRDGVRRVRAVAVVAGLGAVAVLVVAFAVEGIAQRRRRRRADGPAATGERERAPWARALATLAALVVFGAVSAQLVRTATSKWQATATVALVPPQFPVNTDLPLSRRGTQNPFLSYSSSVATLGRLAVIEWGNAPDRSADVVVQDWQPGATPVSTITTPSSLLTATATADSPATATAAAEQATDQLATMVHDLQQDVGAPSATFVGATQGGAPTVTSIHTERWRSAAALALLAIIGAALFGKLVEALIVARRRHLHEHVEWRAAT